MKSTRSIYRGDGLASVSTAFGSLSADVREGFGDSSFPYQHALYLFTRLQTRLEHQGNSLSRPGTMDELERIIGRYQETNQPEEIEEEPEEGLEVDLGQPGDFKNLVKPLEETARKIYGILDPLLEKGSKFKYDDVGVFSRGRINIEMEKTKKGTVCYSFVDRWGTLYFNNYGLEIRMRERWLRKPSVSLYLGETRTKEEEISMRTFITRLQKNLTEDPETGLIQLGYLDNLLTLHERMPDFIGDIQKKVDKKRGEEEEREKALLESIANRREKIDRRLRGEEV